MNVASGSVIEVLNCELKGPRFYIVHMQSTHTIYTQLTHISTHNPPAHTIHTLQVKYRIAENFQGRKLLRISRFCCYTRKFSPWNLGRGVLWRCKSEQSVKVFFAKIVFSPIRESFLPWKFPAIRYYNVMMIKLEHKLNLLSPCQANSIGQF